MSKRREFLKLTAAATLGSSLFPQLVWPSQDNKLLNFGIQLYTFRTAMLKEPIKTLELIASLGFKEVETARSIRGLYYGLSPKEMKTACEDLGMKLISGHVILDESWPQTLEAALESGQEYLICSSMPFKRHTRYNYQKVAQIYNTVGEACKTAGIKFGYHNHATEFQKNKGEVLYEILLDETDKDLVHLQLDLGWVLYAGADPLRYLQKYPGRFPLYHLKDMDMKKGQSTELGSGSLPVAEILKHLHESDNGKIILEQEEYNFTPAQSMQRNLNYLKNLN